MEVILYYYILYYLYYLKQEALGRLQTSVNAGLIIQNSYDTIRHPTIVKCPLKKHVSTDNPHHGLHHH